MSANALLWAGVATSAPALLAVLVWIATKHPDTRPAQQRAEQDTW